MAGKSVKSVKKFEEPKPQKVVEKESLTHNNETIPMQVFKEFFLKLSEHEDFDANTLEQIKKLIENGDIRKPQQIMKVIKITSGGEK